MKIFNELFNEAVELGTILKPKNEFHKEAIKNFYYVMFKIWLQGNKASIYKSENKASNLITKDNWLEYIKELESSEIANKSKLEFEKLNWQQVNELITLKKIYYYKEIQWCKPLRNLSHTIETFIGFMKPFNAKFNTLKYFDFFFKNIDFDKIESIGSGKPTNEEIKKYCNSIYYGLEQIFRIDINKVISNFENNIPNLSKNEAVKIQKELISVIGNLKRQTRNNKEGISFTERYNLLYKNIENRERLLHIDYQNIIMEFEQTLSNDLLSTFEIINETLLNTIPLLKEEQTENHFDSNQPLKNYELFYSRYKKFLVCIVNNDVREFYNTCNDLNKFEMLEVSYRAEQEVKSLLSSQNNNVERFIKRLQRETTELIELRKKVYDTHKINNAQTKDFNNLLGAFQYTIVGLKGFLDAILPLIENETKEPQQIEKLSDLITHENSVKIVDCIKIQYKNIKGKQLKLLLLAFQDLGLLPKERIAQKFYNCCKNEFNWNIASYNAMNGYDFNKHTDNDTFTEVKQYIETIIKTN